MRRKIVFTLLFICILAFTAMTAIANEATPAAVYEKLFTSRPLQSDWFAPEFLAQIPLAQMEAIVAQYVEMLGAYEATEGQAPMFRLRFARGYAPSQIALNAAGQIAGIWFGPPEPEVGTLQDALSGYDELPGRVSVLVASDSGILAAINPDVPLAVGSAFKLAVAAALADHVAAGHFDWEHVIHLSESDESLPSGILQQWPVGTPLTVGSLAALMISQSDNTATDALMRHLGRETVELYGPRNKPFLTTREAFTLKDPTNREFLTAFRAGDEAGRRAVVEDLRDVALPRVFDLPGEPTALDVEWLFTVRELGALMAHVNELPFMSINPGPATPDHWQRVAYKGGSEPGVLNLTTFVTSHSGSHYIVSATWNDAEAVLDENRFVTLYIRLLNALKQLDD